MHSTDDLNDGYVGSGKRLRYSIRKHGLENHSVEILEYHESRDELALRESELVNPETLTDPQCLNLKLGGEGGQSSEIAKRNWENPEYRGAVTKVIRARSSTDANKERFREAKKLRHVGDTQKIDYDWTGKTHREETKRLISEKARARHTKPSDNSQYGTCWITHPTLGNKKIPKATLGEYEPSGWVLGRKMVIQ
jgi:hypothetical protein